MVRIVFGGILCLFRSDWSLRWLDVCICTDASEKWFAFAVLKDVLSWPRKLVVSRGGQGSREVPGPPSRVRAVPPRQMSFWNVQVRTRRGVLCPVSRTSREVSLQFLDPSEWTLAACGGFFREENVILEARSILHVVRHAESNYPPERLLILSDSLAYWCTAKDAQKHIQSCDVAHACSSGLVLSASVDNFVCRCLNIDFVFSCDRGSFVFLLRPCGDCVLSYQRFGGRKPSKACQSRICCTRIWKTTLRNNVENQR